MATTVNVDSVLRTVTGVTILPAVWYCTAFVGGVTFALLWRRDHAGLSTAIRTAILGAVAMLTIQAVVVDRRGSLRRESGLSCPPPEGGRVWRSS